VSFSTLVYEKREESIVKLKSIKWQAIIFLSIISIIVGGCASQTLATTLKADRTVLFLGEHANIECTVSNSTGNITYEWSCNGGSIQGEGAVVDWFAPDNTGAYTIKVKAKGENGESGGASVKITVMDNHRPIIEDIVVTAEHKYLKKITDETGYWVGKAQTYHIECQAQDQDNDSLTYEWSCSGGDIQGSGSGVTWIAPNPEGSVDVTITVTASDGKGGVATKDLLLKVVRCSVCTFG
jgi:hypothetical protein